MNTDAKIRIFKEHINNILEVAQKISDDFQADENALSKGGYAIFLVVIGYFETIAKFTMGCSLEYNKANYQEGFSYVFGQNNNEARDKLWQLRCGMYHGLMPDKGQFMPISRDIDEVFKVENGILIINPAKLTSKIREHFKAYITDLECEENKGLRENFQAFYETLGKHPYPQNGEEPNTPTTPPPHN